jgi:NADH:ubiquinone oxidoreductase subunit K
MSSEASAILFMIGMSGYLIFRFWKMVLKLIIGILFFCVAFTFITLKKYYDELGGDTKKTEKMEQVVQETVIKSTPGF